jgi:CheY-like chemotaxis protein
VLTVADTGAGIAAEHLPRVFDRFHRIEGVPARTHEGSGIGLALVHELVSLHGGKIEVESEPGQGTSFRVSLRYGNAHLPRNRLGEARDTSSESLPAKAFVEEAMSWLQGSEESAGAPRPGRTPLQDAPRILVADDNADMRGYIARLLGTDWEVETAADGEEALARLRARRFDLVISDVMMPRVDGFGLLQAIRADAALATTPIILLSARAGEEARIEGLDCRGRTPTGEAPSRRAKWWRNVRAAPRGSHSQGRGRSSASCCSAPSAPRAPRTARARAAGNALQPDAQSHRDHARAPSTSSRLANPAACEGLGTEGRRT